MRRFEWVAKNGVKVFAPYPEPVDTLKDRFAVLFYFWAEAKWVRRVVTTG